jgi:integrase/recombinase XerD
MKTLEDWSQEYVQHLRSRRFSKATQDLTRHNLKRFARWFRENYHVEVADELTGEYLRRWHIHITSACTKEGRPYSPWTVNSHLNAVRGLIAYLARQGYSHMDLRDHLPYQKTPQYLPGTVISHAQARSILSRLPASDPRDYRNRAMLELLYSSGIRAAEILGLSLQDIHFTHGTVKVLGKGNKERMVPVGRTAMRYLETYIKAVRPFQLKNPAETAVFLNHHGKRIHYTMLLRIVHDCMHKVRFKDVHVTPHTFRRSCTTELIRGGANMYHVKELLGHESLDTLKHYAKLTINDLKATHEKCHPRERDEPR